MAAVIKFKKECGKEFEENLIIKTTPTKLKGKGGFLKTIKGITLRCCEFTYDKKYLHIPFHYACERKNKFYNENSDAKEINLNFEGIPRVTDKVDQVSVIKEAKKQLKKYHTTSLSLPTGYGKTFISVLLACWIGYKVCILNYREIIERSWIKTIKKYIPDAKISVVGKKTIKDADIVLCMVGSVNNIKDDMESFGTLIIDESHAFCTKTGVKAILKFTPKYIIAASATPSLTETFQFIDLVVGTHKVFRESMDKFDAFIIKTNIHINIEGEECIFNELCQKQSENIDRINLIEKLIRHNSKSKIMVINNRKNLSDTLCDIIPNSAPFYGNIKSFKDSRVLIGTASKMGTGFDESNSCSDYKGNPSDLGIITFTFKTEGPFIQVKGRVVGRCENPKIIYLEDENRISKSHMRLMRKWIEESGGTIYTHHYDPDTYSDDNSTLNLEDIKRHSLPSI